MSAYIGRFAPSPTGFLHLGSLLTAVASWCDARAAQGQWLLRIEDVDSTRCQPQAVSHILQTLTHYGLWWDGEVSYQSQRTALYQDALSTLANQGHIFWCTCSRAELLKTGAIYTGTCRAQQHHRPHAAARMRVYPQQISFNDRIFGTINEQLDQTVGDFVVFRRDGLFAYQLAVVVDDHQQGITHVVRGADLLDNTARQIYLQQCLGFRIPSYSHLPLVVNAQGEKLSKQTGASALALNSPTRALWQVLTALGQCPPNTLQSETAELLLAWAVQHWQPQAIPSRFKLDYLS